MFDLRRLQDAVSLKGTSIIAFVTLSVTGAATVATFAATPVGDQAQAPGAPSAITTASSTH